MSAVEATGALGSGAARTRASPPASPARARERRLASVPEDSLAFALALGRGQTHRASGSSASPSTPRSKSYSAAPASSSPSRPAMTTSQTSVRASGSPLRSSASDKGKEREWSSAEGTNALASSSSTSTLKQAAISGRAMKASPQRRPPPARPNWVVDLDQVATGSKRWKEGRVNGSARGKVVLVMGEPSPSTLDRLLAEPLFSASLIIVASRQPKDAPASPPASPRRFSMARPPSAYSLSSEYKAPTSLNSASRPGSTYGLPSLSEDGDQAGGLHIEYITSRSSRPVKDILEEAASIARKWRGASSNPPSRVASPPASRRGSSNEITAGRPRPTSIASFRSLTRSSTSDNLQGATSPDALCSPFDVLLHFVPADLGFQVLLQQAVMLTTAALPLMDRQLRSPATAGSLVDTDASATLLHILPRHSPQPLSRVLDSFLASMIPPLHPSLRGFVLAEELLEAPLRVGRNGHTGFSALDVVVSGGLACSATQGGARPRSYLGSFSDCRFLGLSLDPPMPASQAISRASSSASLSDTTTEAPARRPSANDRGYESSQLATAVWTASQGAPESSDFEEADLQPPRLSWSEGGESTTSSASLPTTPDLDARDMAGSEVGSEVQIKAVVECHGKPVKKGWFGRAFGRKAVPA